MAMCTRRLFLPRRTGKASNYAYGRAAEKKVGKAIKEELGGTYKRTTGSRGPYDVHNKTETGHVLTQVKASRADAKTAPYVSTKDQTKLIIAAAEKHLKTGETVTAATVLCKGGKIVQVEALATFGA
ncbi:MAG: hypothetical protein KGL39_01260 [Patescibacteria group bacterium]|nr:hypothetical protein [Patescibacteria group bacterium]